MATSSPSQPSPEFRQQVHNALRSWNDPPNTHTLAGLHLVNEMLRTDASNPRQATNRVLLQALDWLAISHQQLASVLRLRFLDKMTTRGVGNRLNASEPSVYRWQAQAIEQLSKVLFTMEAQAVQQRTTLLHARLETPSYVGLIGVDPVLEHLLPLLLSAEPPWIVALEGIGGIGKTSLADTALRRVIQQRLNGEVAWLCAKQYRLDFSGKLQPRLRPALTIEDMMAGLAQQLLPGAPHFNSPDEAIAPLRARFAQTPTLIVLDNLETAADVEGLFPWLERLANPAKFLLTSRYNLFNEPMVCHVPVTPLSEENALRLLRQDAKQRHFPLLLQADEDQLRPIYQTVGGNPLALRLVNGQAHGRGLAPVLDELQSAHGQPAEALYNFVYHAAWQRLDEPKRRALLAMPLVIESGGSLEQVTAITGLPIDMAGSALSDLVMLNLVDSYGPLSKRTYAIHPLTRTFLLQQVLRW